MSGQLFLTGALIVTFLVLSLAFVLIVIRIVKGPSLSDRILALDLLIAVAIGYIAAFGISTGYSIYVDIAIALGLVGFLSTIALARFVLSRRTKSDDEDTTGEGVKADV
ncbi:MAG: cation:proton antiporter [Pseudomonadota bacterium]